jgi:monoamine oxidase
MLTFLMQSPAFLAAPPRIVIVGAGISGLSAAYQLKKDYGLDAQVYEASERVGGRVFTKSYPKEGVRVELGASFIDNDHYAIRALAEELQLKLAPLKNEGRGERIFLFDGKTLNLCELYNLFLPTLKLIQRDLDQISREKRENDAEITATEAQIDKLTIRQYLNSLDAPELFHRLVDATQFTEYGARIDKMTAMSLLDLITIDFAHQSFAMDGQLGDEGHKISGGNSLVPQRLAELLTYPIKLHHQLTEVSLMDDNRTFNLRFLHNNEIVNVEADYLILALPTPVLKDNIKIDHEKLLNKNISKVIQQFIYGNVTKFIMVFREPVWRTNPGEMVEILSDKYDIWESSFNELGNNNFHLTIYTGEPDALVDMDQNPQSSAEEVLQHLETLIPNIRSAYIGNAPSMHWPTNPFTKGAFSGVFLPGQWAERKIVENPGVGNIAFSGEQWSLDHAGFMEGGIETGQWAARYIGDRVMINLQTEKERGQRSKDS